MNNITWQILCWNIRGINAVSKWEAVRDKIEKSACSVLCLHETKKEHFDMAFIRNFAHRHFDRFEFIPSMGASGGILVVWNSSCFVGQVVDKQQFGFSTHLTSVYGPCTEPNQSEFINWFRSHNIADTDNWIF